MGVPTYHLSDKGLVFNAQTCHEVGRETGIRTLYVKPGPPWGYGYIEDFSGDLMDEVLKREILYTLLDMMLLTEK